MGFARVMSSAAGRAVRVVAGLALIGAGIYLVVQTSTLVVGVVLIIVGVLPLVAGLFDFCVFAPLFGAPFSGSEVRARTH